MESNGSFKCFLIGLLKTIPLKKLKDIIILIFLSLDFFSPIFYLVKSNFGGDISFLICRFNIDFIYGIGKRDILHGYESILLGFKIKKWIPSINPLKLFFWMLFVTVDFLKNLYSTEM